MLLGKIQWAFKLLRSRTFLVLTDKSSVVYIPLANINSFDNTILLAAQTASLQEFRARLEDLIKEHEEAIRLLNHRTSVRKEEPVSSKSRTKVSKASKKAQS